MFKYDMAYYCEGYITLHCIIHLSFNDQLIGTICYIEDPFQSFTPSVSYDRFPTHEQFRAQIPKIDPLKIAQDAIAERILLGPNR